MSVKTHVNLLLDRYPCLEPVITDIEQAFDLLLSAFQNGKKLLIAGNGGSSADAEHIVGELMKGFVKQRNIGEDFAKALKEANKELADELSTKLQGALPAISLSGHASLNTAFSNDVDGMLCFAQQTYGYGVEGDVLLAISTSGNSKNILYAAAVAKAKGMKVIGLTGRDGGKLAEKADACIIVPEQETYKIQELHLPVYHTLCLMLEEILF